MKTQIYGTFGPACASEEILIQMIECGLTGMRLNLSHSSLRDSKSYVEAYQKACARCGVMPQILIDMQGPELRIGRVKLEKEVQIGKIVAFGEDGIDIPKQLWNCVDIGDEILVDDGKIFLKVISKDRKKVEAKILRGGILKSHKSIKIVEKNVPMPVLTEHDIQNIKEAKTYGVTALMQPFVLRGEDLVQVKQMLNQSNVNDIQIFAKIENQIGVSNLESIVQAADVIIIARGDLGNDMPLWELPRVQKQIEETCKRYRKPYIVVTQMLASMEQNPVPTRAEVSDIFHAVMHGAYGVMVTGETAVGKYPVEVIKYLANTAKEAEDYGTVISIN